MFGNRDNHPGPRRPGTLGFVGLFALLALLALGLAFSPRMAQLAATGAQSGPEANGSAAETTQETASSTAPEGTLQETKAVSPAGETSSGTAAESPGGTHASEPKSGQEKAQEAKEEPGPGEPAAESGSAKTVPAEAEKEQPRERKERDDQEDKNLKEQETPEPPAPSDKTMSLSIPRLAAVRADTVLNSDSPEALDRAAIKLPSTGFPWQEGANTYIAGHRIGWPGTETRYQFYYLPAMRKGDAVYLTDANGTTYEYRVTEKFAVKPSENWVTEPVAGRDMVTLQTCTETVNDWWTIGPKLMESGPDSGRLIVRADKVATYPA